MTKKRQNIADNPTVKVTKQDMLTDEATIKVEKDSSPKPEKKKVVITSRVKIKRNSVIEVIKASMSGDKADVLLDSKANASRYSVGELLGSGGYGQVFSVKDNDLKRDVAVKITDTERGKNAQVMVEFTSEAQVLAGLEHPNIIPIYDIDIDDNGKIYLSMRKITGHSLKKFLLQGGRDNKIPEEIDSPGKVVQIFLKICDALQYAHSRDRLHQDIKPENIMIGEFGEVFLIDWGSSSSSINDECLKVTPGYMSPEQSIGDDTDQRTDVYSLGTTMFHLLYHRLPINAPSLTEMMKKKREGIIEPLTEHEKSKVPPPLEAIIMKALKVKPEDRYQSIAEMTTDLLNYQMGQAVSVYRDTLFAFVRRSYNRHKRHIWYAFFILLLLSASFTVLWREKLKEIAYWGKPKYICSFEGKSWQSNWVVMKGKFVNGKKSDIVSDSPGSSVIIFKKKLYGSTAVEMSAEMLEGYPIGDLSLMWIHDIEWGDDYQIKGLNDIYYFQTGAWNNTFCMIQKSPLRLAFAPKILKPGKRYLIRIEIDVCTLRLFLDGEKICEYTRYLPFNEGYIGIYAYNSGKSFSNIKIYSKGVPEKVGILVVGDELFRNKEFNAAEKAYKKIAAGTNNPKIREQALYREGLSLYLLKNTTDAFEVWRLIQDPLLKQRVGLFKIREIFNKGDYNLTQKLLTKLYKHADKTFKAEIELEWGNLIAALYSKRNRPELRRFLQLQEKLFPDSSLGRFSAAVILEYLGDTEKLITQYKDFPIQYIQARIDRGELNEVLIDPQTSKEMFIQIFRLSEKHEEILKVFPRRRINCAQALFDLKRFKAILSEYPDVKPFCAAALLRLDRYKELIKRYPRQQKYVAMALNAKGKYERVLQDHAQQKLSFTYAACSVGKPELALNKYPENIDVRNYVECNKALKEYFSGDKNSGIAALTEIMKQGGDVSNSRDFDANEISKFYFYWLPLILDINAPDGLKNKTNLKKVFNLVKNRYRYAGHQHYYHTLAFLMGKVDKKTFLAQEVKYGLDLEYDIYSALKAEYDGNVKEAILYYKKLDKEYRANVNTHTLTAIFVRNRLKELKGK